MYIIDGICYAGSDANDIKVKEAKPLSGGMLLLTFTSGEKRLYDTTQLQGSAFEPLKNDEVFKKINIFHGIITWMDGEIDIAPETLYADSLPYDSAEL